MKPIFPLAAVVLLSMSRPSFAKVTATKDMLFGVSNSAFQVEGSPMDSDWYRWTKTPGRIQDGSHADRATDFWTRYEEDFALARAHGMNVFRISLAWERLEPKPGEWDMAALQHYAAMIKTMHRYGLEPMVTVNHYVLPVWVAEQGGLLWQGFPQAFARFSQHVVQHLAPGAEGVRYWLTINEPIIHIQRSYHWGIFPPGAKSYDQGLLATANLARAHIEAVRAIRPLAIPGLKISFAHNWQIFDPKDPKSQADRAARDHLHDSYNLQFMTAVMTGKLHFTWPGASTVIDDTLSLPAGKPTIDYVAIQQYGRSFVTTGTGQEVATSEGNGPKNDLGWELVPDALYRALQESSIYQLPIIVTETGLADAKDTQRPQYLRDNFTALAKARREGIDVFGYLHWSLTDNFEWAFGSSWRFGLVDIDYRSLARKPRPSLRVYQQLIQDFVR